MYMQGFSQEGRTMNILAYFWLSMSDDPRAKDNLLYLESIMTTKELNKAKKMIEHHNKMKGNDNKGETEWNT